MSLLSSTQGTPERVWSLINLLQAHEGRLPRESVFEWLSPTFVQAGQKRVISGEPDGQAVGAATSLELVERDGASLALTASAPVSFQAFSDQVHARLCSIDETDPDYVVLETFAWVAVEVERRQSTGWAASSPQEFADAAEHALGGSDERRFNSTKLPPWRRWITLLGLGVDLPGVGFYPYVTERVRRELTSSGLQAGVELKAAEVLAALARRAPYLDGGALFNSVAERVGVRLPSRRVTRLLSTALRDLHEEGALALTVRGDASELIELAPDGQHPIKTVQTIVLKDRL